MPGLQGPRGPIGSALFLDNLVVAKAIPPTIGLDVSMAMLLRYTALSPLVPAMYVERSAEPAHDLWFTDIDGRIFSIEERYIDVRMAGAMSDNATNDAAAVSRARVAARVLGAIPFFPLGTTLVTSPLSGSVNGLVDEDQFEGAHKNKSILKFAGAMTNCIEPDDPLEVTNGVRVRRMSIHGDGALTKVGLFAPAFRKAEFFEVEFDGFTQSGILSYGERDPDGFIGDGFPGDSTYNILWDCDILGGMVPVHLTGNPNSTDRTHGGTSNMWTVQGGRSASAEGIANFYLEQGASVRLIAHAIVAGAGDGLRLAWYGSIGVGNVSENNGPNGIVVTSSDPDVVNVVNVGGNYVTLSSNSEPALGRRVAPTTTGVLPGGLGLSALYEIPTGTTKQTRFAASLADALANNPITITSIGSGTHTFTKVASTWTCAAAAVDVTNNKLTLSNGPATLRNGDPVMLSSSGSLPGGLSAGAVDPVTKGSTGTVYFAVLTGTDNVIQLSLTYIGAIADTPVVIDITSQGTGTHTVTEQLLGFGVRYENVVDCHDNKLIGQHDGGSNDVGFVVDENGYNDIIGSHTGLKLSQQPSSTIMPLALYGKGGHGLFNAGLGAVNYTLRYFAALRRADTSQDLGTGSSPVTVLWDHKDSDPYNLLTLDAITLVASQIVCPVAGYVDIDATVKFTANSSGYRRLEIMRASASTPTSFIQVGEETKTAVNGTFTSVPAKARALQVAAGDIIICQATHTSGAALQLLHTIANQFSVKYIGGIV